MQKARNQGTVTVGFDEILQLNQQSTFCKYDSLFANAHVELFSYRIKPHCNSTTIP